MMNLNEFTQLSSDLKKQFIDTFLKQCNPSDLHYLEDKLGEYKRDFLSYLPSEIAYLILDYLDWKDLLNCCQVSSNWNKIISNDIGKIWKKWCINQNLITSNQREETEEIDYKDLYLHLKRKEKSLESGNEFNESSISMAPAEMNAIACYKNIVATTVNHIVYFWQFNLQLNKWTQLNELILETSVADFKFNNEYLICVNYFFTIHVYSLNRNELISELIGHTAKITSFDFNSNLLVSCSADHTIRIWSLSQMSLMQTNQIEEYPLKISILESSSLNLFLTITSQGVLYVQHFINSELTLSTQYALNSSNLDFDYNDLSEKSYFRLFDTQLVGYFIMNNNAKKENKLFIEVYSWNDLLKKFDYKAFDNNSCFDYLNQYRLNNNCKFEIVTFGLKYCLFVDQNDNIYLTNLKSKLINLIVNSRDSPNKKGIFEYGNSQIGRKTNFKFNDSTWLDSLSVFGEKNNQVNKNEPVFVFHGGQSISEVFIISWKNFD